jgi:hypothetical protein
MQVDRSYSNSNINHFASLKENTDVFPFQYPRYHCRLAISLNIARQEWLAITLANFIHVRFSKLPLPRVSSRHHHAGPQPHRNRCCGGAGVGGEMASGEMPPLLLDLLRRLASVEGLSTGRSSDSR